MRNVCLVVCRAAGDGEKESARECARRMMRQISYRELCIPMAGSLVGCNIHVCGSGNISR